jgi:hypothetical protein
MSGVRQQELTLVQAAALLEVGFDDKHRRKPPVEKLERFVNFKPQTPLRKIIRLTAR